MGEETKDDQITSFSKDLKNHHWWVEDVSSVLRPEVREMLEKYSGIPSDKVIEHIKEAVYHNEPMHIFQTIQD